MLTIKERREQHSASLDSTSSCSVISTPNHQSQKAQAQSPRRITSFLTRRSEEPISSSFNQRSFDAETAGPSTGRNGTHSRMLPVTPAPSVIRLLESVKMIVDRTGCSMIALKHLESGLQLLCTRAHVLVDLIITEGPDLLQQPARMASVVG